jgi:hypothetical protein
VFYDWLDADTFEQTLRVDGTRQQDLVVRNPGYPDPYNGGATTEFLPPSKYALARGLLMPRRTMVNVGVGEQLSRILAANVSVMHSTGTNRLRGRNVNAPFADGMRPDPAAGNITEVESTGRLRGTSVNAGVNLSIPTRRTFLLANYSWIQQKNDADGPFSLPADSHDLSGEWGPAAGVPHHLFSGIANTTLPRNIRVGVAATARTGLPYNITTGRDDNGDTVFNDRPSGIRRNSATSQGMWDVAARLSYAFGFGQRPISPGAPAGPTMIVQRVGGTAGAGDMLGAMNSGGPDGKRIRVEVFVYAQNLFNHVNPIAYSGVMTSPFFGQPTAAMPARKIDVGVRIGF